MKKTFIILITIIGIFSSCSSQNTDFLSEKSSILKNHQMNLSRLSKIANVIDSDDASFWGYEYADSLLSTIDYSGLNYYNDLTKIFSAYTYIFTGMSYTRTIYAMSRGEKYSLDELYSLIILPSNGKIANYSELAKKEQLSFYSIINFYKVSRMPKYTDLQALYFSDSLTLEQVFKQYSPISAYKIVSLENKRLYFKILASLIVDIHSINYQEDDEADFRNFITQLVSLGEELDGIPTDHELIIKLSDKEYFKNAVMSSIVQNTMLNLLVNELIVLKAQNE